MPPNRWKNLALVCPLAATLLSGNTSGSETERHALLQTAASQPLPDPQTLLRANQETSEKLPSAPASKQLAVNEPSAAATPDDRAGASEVASQPVAEDIFDRRVLEAHNREREMLGLAPLRWNPALAHDAQIWAEHLASTGRFEHAPENRAAPEGENLWAGTKGYYAPEAMVQAWIREKKFFRPGAFPDNSITGRVEDVGHYTQLVWRATTELGCAKARSSSEDILVCRYAEAGNYRGEQPF